MVLNRNMVKPPAISVALCLALSACAGSQAHMRGLERDNALSVQPSTNPAYDFAVSIRNLKDFGYDPDDKATRDRTALTALKEQCPTRRIVGETVINTGRYPVTGAPARTYVMQVKC